MAKQESKAKDGKLTREERLAKNLRDNLRRRKAAGRKKKPSEKPDNTSS